MWSKTYSQKVTGLSAERLWKAWTDINEWHTWQDDVEYAKLDGELAAGKTFVFRPKGGGDIHIELTCVEPGKRFDDLTRFPGARMLDVHEIIEHGNSLELRTTTSMEGPLSFLWRKLVAEGVASGLRSQTERLIEHAKNI